MIEKVNPKHPDKIADRIAGAIVDLAYHNGVNPHIAVEVLIGHGAAHIIVETDTEISSEDVRAIIDRIAGRNVYMDLQVVEQDRHLAKNQANAVRCGDNGIFKGVPLNAEQKALSSIARHIYNMYPSDGKYILDKRRLTICQSKAPRVELEALFPTAIVNPLGAWTGGIDVDTGATNRKLGSDMADSITGGGLHGKDLSKADVSVNIYAFLEAQETGHPVEYSCSIGDTEINGIPYADIVRKAAEYIASVGGFEKFAEWGLF